jgi:hypothetical protein
MVYSFAMSILRLGHSDGPSTLLNDHPQHGSLVVDDRLCKALKKELINAQLQSKLSRDVDSKIAKRQREYYLMEQLKGIKKSRPSCKGWNQLRVRLI